LSRFFLLCLLLVAGCKARDGDILHQVARRTGQKLEGAITAPARQLPTRVPNPMTEVSVAARVDARLRYDRHLSDHSFVVRAQGASAVVVAGTVPEASIKQRALDLAKSTVGVDRVVDEVQLSEEP
jgi:hypothetical protein